MKIETELKVVKLYQEGLLYEEIYKLTKVNNTSINRVAKKYNLPRRLLNEEGRQSRIDKLYEATKKRLLTEAKFIRVFTQNKKVDSTNKKIKEGQSWPEADKTYCSINYYQVETVAKFLGLSPDSVRRLIRDKKLKAVRLKNRYFVVDYDLEYYLKGYKKIDEDRILQDSLRTLSRLLE